MAASNFSGPLQVTGEGVVSRPVEVLVVPLSVLAQANTDFSFLLPACRILRMTQRTNVAFTGNTATLQVGSAAGGAEYVAAADIKAQSAGRAQALVAGASVTMDAFAGGVVFGRIVQTATFTAVGSGSLHVEFVRTGA